MRVHVLIQKWPPLLPLAESSPIDLDQPLRSDQLVLGLLKHQEEGGLQDQQKDQDEQIEVIYLPPFRFYYIQPQYTIQWDF